MAITTAIKKKTIIITFRQASSVEQRGAVINDLKKLEGVKSAGPLEIRSTDPTNPRTYFLYTDSANVYIIEQYLGKQASVELASSL